MLYVLYYGIECGDREDCSIFYTPFEIFDDKDLMIERRKKLRIEQKSKGNFEYTHVVCAYLNNKIEENVNTKELAADPAFSYDDVFDAHYLK